MFLCIEPILCACMSLFVTFIILKIFCLKKDGKKNNNSIARWKLLYFNPLPSLSSLKTFNTHPAQKNNNNNMKWILFRFFLLNYQLNDCNNVILLTTRFLYMCMSLIQWSGTVKMIVRTLMFQRDKHFLKQFLFNFYSFDDLKPLEWSNFGLKYWWNPFCFKTEKTTISLLTEWGDKRNRLWKKRFTITIINSRMYDDFQCFALCPNQSKSLQ